MKQTKASILYFMGPAMLLFCLIFIYPVSRTAIMSFFSVKSVTSAVSTWSWAGLDNYIKLFHTPLFITSVINIGKIWLYCGIACLGLAIALAIILTSGLRGQKFFRAIIYMPNVIAAVAVGYMWLLYVYNAKFGLFHSFFTALGWESMANFQWLGTDHMFLSMCIAYVFSNVGYFMLMYIAAIEKISPDYYEAATIEGANIFDKFFHITLPLIKGVLGTSLVLWTTKTMGFFALAQVFGGVSTYTPMMYTYQTLFGSEISADSMNTGVAAAAACIMTIVVVAVSTISRKSIKDDGYERYGGKQTMAKAKKEKMEANPFKLKKELPRLPGYIIVTLWTAFIFCMIGWIILASLSTTKEIFTGSLLASGLHFENYTKALFTNKAALNLLNSVIYTVPSCILIIVVCAPAAYCMSRFKFRGAGLIQALIIIGLAIPNIMIVMPLFSVVSALKLSGTHFTLIFLYTACSVPYTTFFLLTFFKGISTSIQCFWKIMFPLAQPAIVTVSIFNFIGKWNEYFMALIFANKSNLRPIGVGLYQTVTSMMNSGDWAGMFASVVIVFVPTVVIYAFLSDKIISGVTAGGNKG